MQKLILINGFGGSGKTSVGRLLLDALPSSALLDFDALTCVNPFEYGEQLFQLGHRNAAAVTEVFLKARYQHLIMCGGCHTQRHLDGFLSLLPRELGVSWFFLITSSEERRRRKIARSRDDADKSEWFDELEAKEGLYEGLVSGPNIEAFELLTERKTPAQVMSELKEILARTSHRK